MDDRAFRHAEVTLLYTKVKYRDPISGAEKEAMQIKPYGLVKYAEAGQEGGFIVPINITYEGQGSITDGDLSATRFFLEPAPIEDEKEFPHKFEQL